MAKRDTINKGIFWITVNEQLDIEAFYPESSAELIHADSTKFAAKNVLAALNEIVDKINSLDTGVTGVKGNAESTYRKGNVNLTPANIGAEPAFSKNTAFNKNFGTTAGTVMEGDDSRVTQAVSDITAIKQKNTAQDTEIAKKLNASEKGAANGVATLDSQGMVPASQLPSYVDDVLEFDSKSNFPATGEDGKIYIAKDTNLQYRWSGTAYVEISPSLALGETAQTAYPGNKGKQNADDIAGLKSGTIHAGIANKIAKKFAVSGKNKSGANVYEAYDGTLYQSVWFDNRTFTLKTEGAIDPDSKDTGVLVSVDLKEIVTAGTYNSVTIDTQGRVTKGENKDYALKSDVPGIKVDNAVSADKVAKPLNIAGYKMPGNTLGGIQYNGSSAWTLYFKNDFNFAAMSSDPESFTVELAATGIVAGTYSAVTVDSKGRATAGYQALSVINEGDPIPSNLVVGGLIIEKHVQA